MSERGPAHSSFLAQRYSADAVVYDELWSPVIRPVGDELVAEMRLANARRVLDAGTGAGALVPAIRSGAPAASVTGLDVAVGMLGLAKGRHDIACVAGDAMAIPFDAGSFDAVVLAYVLFHLGRPDVAMAEAARVLRPGGVVGTITWASEGSIVAGSLLDAALDDVDAPAPPWSGDHAGLSSPAQVRARMHRAGFTESALWTATITHQFTIDSFWRLRTTGGNTGWRLRQLGDAERPELLARVRRQFDALTPGELVYRGEVVVAVATKA
jgi:SAM-dependent methyltransferase